MPHAVSGWLRALGLGAVAAVVACADKGGGAQPLALTTHPALESGIVALWKGGGTVALASLTDFDWDSVTFYREGTPATVIHADLGQRVLGEQKYFTNARNLFVFRLRGQPVRLVMNSADLFAGTDYRRPLGRSLTLSAPAPGEGLIALSLR